MRGHARNAEARRSNTGVLLLGLLLLPAAPAAGETPDIKMLLTEAMTNGRGVDRTAWGRHAFKRHVTRRQIDETGDVEFSQVMRFQVTPSADGLDEELLEIDGREPTAKEVAKHRRAGRFEKHYEQTEEVLLENPFGSDLPLLPLVLDQEHRYAGEDVVDGIPCHRLVFDARPDPGNVPAPDKLRYAMKGSLCISREGARMMQVEVSSVREVVKKPVRIKAMTLRFEARPHGDVYLPTKFELESDVRLLGTRMRKHNTYRYSDYRKP